MQCKLVRGHDGTYRLTAQTDKGVQSGFFEPGRRTLTGAKHRNGELRAMTASMLRAYLGVEPGQLVEPYDEIEVDDRGIFDPLSPVDISMHAKTVYHVVDVPVRVLMGACALESRKQPKERD